MGRPTGEGKEVKGEEQEGNITSPGSERGRCGWEIS